jgi:hypothetical protein
MAADQEGAHGVTPPTWQDFMQDGDELMSVPLHNFTSDLGLVIFDDALFLRRMDTVDREGLRLPYNPYGSAPLSLVVQVTDSITGNWTHCVSARMELARVASEAAKALHTAFARMRAVVTALHILHAGPVVLPLNYQQQRDVKRVTGGGMIRMLPHVRHPPYQLAVGDVEALRALVVAHEATAAHGYRLATRRLDLSYDRLEEEDRLLDFWIALEALFAPDGRRGEITYKISRRIAFFLSDDRARRLQIAKRVKRSYTARSNIVHGDAIADLKAIGDETEELLRAALRRWLLLDGSKQPNEVVKGIDDSMFGGPAVS